MCVAVAYTVRGHEVKHIVRGRRGLYGGDGWRIGARDRGCDVLYRTSRHKDMSTCFLEDGVGPRMFPL